MSQKARSNRNIPRRRSGAKPGLRTTGLAAGSRPAGRATRGSAIATEAGSTKSPRTRAERRAAASRKRGPSRTPPKHHGRDAAMAELDAAGITARAAGEKAETEGEV